MLFGSQTWQWTSTIYEYMLCLAHLSIRICKLLVCACGPKTVPVKRTFLNIAIVGWGGGGMLTFLVLRTWNIATLLRSLGSFTTLHVATLLMGWGGLGWGGVGWGGMLTFLVLRTWNIATLLRSLGSFTTLHVATLLRSLGSFTTLHVATWSFTLGSFTAMTLKSQKMRPKFFQDFQSSNQHGTVVKSPLFKKTCVLWARFPVRRVVCVYSFDIHIHAHIHLQDIHEYMGYT